MVVEGDFTRIRIRTEKKESNFLGIITSLDEMKESTASRFSAMQINESNPQLELTAATSNYPMYTSRRVSR